MIINKKISSKKKVLPPKIVENKTMEIIMK
jgi:hypothetical protein